MSEEINIEGIDKAELLAALYNHSQPMGMGFLQAKPGVMSVEDARKAIGQGDDSSRMFGKHGNRELYFDYLLGRPLKIDIGGNTVRPWGYDRDNGQGAVARIVAELRAKSTAAA